MRIIIVFVAIISLSYQMTTVHHTIHLTAHHTSHHTNGPYTTHEPSITQQYTFHYTQVTQKMFVRKDMNCYIFLLTVQERINVHTDSGLRALEVQFIQMIITGIKTEIVDTSALDHSIRLGCGSSTQHYYTVS
ncbi:hypothetical protein ACJMK2_014940 [Sinanodonta woodiana]|uniref:Uncharacterized protein n=1 Tax=Sinanodonta woodiana TaxID=1069815 RepID=A0ABD3V2T7_SINWO